MQIISSLLELRARTSKEYEQNPAFRESIERIRAMALIHEKLYQSEDLSAIDFAGYIGTLCRHLIRSYVYRGIQIRFSMKGDECLLPIKLAVPLGLIFNELITNSLKYAFQGGQAGEISVDIQSSESLIRFLVSDNGVGVPADFDISNTTTFGFRIVKLLVDQLGGSIRSLGGKGTTFELTVPV